MALSGSYSDNASSSASFTSGAKSSGLNITASRSTPPFLEAILGGQGGGTSGGIPSSYVVAGAILVAALVAVVIVKGRK